MASRLNNQRGYWIGFHAGAWAMDRLQGEACRRRPRPQGCRIPAMKPMGTMRLARCPRRLDDLLPGTRLQQAFRITVPRWWPAGQTGPCVVVVVRLLSHLYGERTPAAGSDTQAWRACSTLSGARVATALPWDRTTTERVSEGAGCLAAGQVESSRGVSSSLGTDRLPEKRRRGIYFDRHSHATAGRGGGA